MGWGQGACLRPQPLIQGQKFGLVAVCVGAHLGKVIVPAFVERKRHAEAFGTLR
jgi:hypothetical protein